MVTLHPPPGVVNSGRPTSSRITLAQVELATADELREWLHSALMMPAVESAARQRLAEMVAAASTPPPPPNPSAGRKRTASADHSTHSTPSRPTKFSRVKAGRIRMMRQRKAIGLTPTQALIWLWLWDWSHPFRGGGRGVTTTHSVIVEQLGLSLTTVSESLTALTAAGLIERLELGLPEKSFSTYRISAPPSKKKAKKGGPADTDTNNTTTAATA